MTITLPDDILDRLGTVPDRLLANEARVSISLVCKVRNERGIPPCRKQGRGLESRHAIVTALQAGPKTSAQLAEETRIQRENMGHVVRALCSEGRIRRLGHGCTTRYELVA